MAVTVYAMAYTQTAATLQWICKIMRLFSIPIAALLLVIATSAESEPARLLLAPVLIGGSVYSVRDFSSEISVSVGKPATATSIDALREAIRAHYVRDGYITPIVTVPSEDLDSATPRIFIFEPKIAYVLIKGEQGPYHDRIAAKLRAVQKNALRKEPLRQALSAISELPGIISHPTLEPLPETPNEFVLVLNISYRAIAGELDINNGGTRQLGRVLYAGSLFLNGVLGVGEQLQLRAASSSLPGRYQFEDGKVLRSFGANELFLDVTHTSANPQDASHFSEENFIVGLNRAIADGSAGTVKLVGRVQADDSMIRDAQNARLVDDHLRSATVGFDFKGKGSTARTSLYSTIDRGTGALGASTLDPPYSEVQVAYTKYQLGFTQSVSFAPLWMIRFNMDGQFSPDVLPIVERFAFGGLGVGEAFDPASLVGDSGAAASAELGRALNLRLKPMQSATAYIRADYGITWNNASYLLRKDDAASLSVGLLSKWPHMLGTVNLSTPLHQPTYGQPASSLRGLVSVALTF